MTLDGDKLVFNLKEPFNALLNSKKNSTWYPLPALLRQKYYRYVLELAKEVEVAKSFLNAPLGLFNATASSL